ncbi:hypothetical protein BC567DRAFT_41351 [Phyllosticta citribraziliensis]
MGIPCQTACLPARLYKQLDPRAPVVVHKGNNKALRRAPCASGCQQAEVATKMKPTRQVSHQGAHVTPTSVAMLCSTEQSASRPAGRGRTREGRQDRQGQGTGNRQGDRPAGALSSTPVVEYARRMTPRRSETSRSELGIPRVVRVFSREMPCHVCA